MAGFIPFIPAAISIGSSLFGGGDSGGGGSSGTGTTSSGASVPFYTPGGLSAADKMFQDALRSLSSNNPYATAFPGYQTIQNKVADNPYAAGAQAGANTAGGMDANAAAALSSLAGITGGESAGLAPFMGSILNTGFDPQKDLYKKLLQSTTDLSNVHNAQYGLTGQQAAGNVDTATSNFNIDWQNNELTRALQGISGAERIGQTQAGLGQSAGQTATGASDLSNLSGTIPYNAFNSNLNSILQSISGTAAFGQQGNAVPIQLLQSIIPYLNYGSGATNAAVGAASANTSNQQNQGAGIGSAMSMLGSLFGGGSPFGGGGSTSTGDISSSFSSWVPPWQDNAPLPWLG